MTSTPVVNPSNFHVTQFTIAPEQARESLDYFFDQSFPIVKPSESTTKLENKTISMAMSDELLRSSIAIGSDYARLMISVIKFNISEGISSSIDALNGTISWLIPIIKRNEMRCKRKGVSNENGSTLDTAEEGPELSGLDLYTFNLKVGDDEKITFKRYLHTSIVKHNSFLMKRSSLNENYSIDLTELNLLELKGVETAGKSRLLFIELLLDMIISVMYCPVLLFDWILCGRLEIAMECGGNIFDKDFYIMDLKILADFFELTEKKHFKDFIEFELFRNSSKSNELAITIVNNWKKTMCQSIECGDGGVPGQKGIVLFANNRELDGSKESEVTIVKDIVNYRSDFFKIMYQSGMKESTEDVIHLDCSSQVLKAVFEYTYTGSIMDESIALELIIYSDMIGYQMLFNSCAHIIKKNIKNSEDVLNVYNFSKMYEGILGNLKYYCVKYSYILSQNSVPPPPSSSSASKDELIEIPKEIAENELVEDFKLFSYIYPEAIKSAGYYNHYRYVNITSWGEKSGMSRICNVVSRNTFDSPPIFTNEGYIGYQCKLFNPKTDWKNTATTNPVLICAPVTMTDKEEFFTAVEDMIAMRKGLGKSYQALAIVLTKCDLPMGVWNVSREEMVDFANRVQVFLFESSAFLKINCTQPVDILYSVQSY